MEDVYAQESAGEVKRKVRIWVPDPAPVKSKAKAPNPKNSPGGHKNEEGKKDNSYKKKGGEKKTKEMVIKMETGSK